MKDAEASAISFVPPRTWRSFLRRSATRRDLLRQLFALAVLAGLLVFGPTSAWSGSGKPGRKDRAAPSAPTNVVADSASQSGISLSWTASTDNVGVSSYLLSVNGGFAAATSSTSYTLSGLACGTTYSIGIAAKDAAGNTSPVTSVSVATAACVDTVPPSTPTQVQATAVTATSISLSWAPSTDNVAVLDYTVAASWVSMGVTATTTYVLRAPACGSTYPVSISAVDAAGNTSAPAVISVASAPCGDSQPPSTPTNLSASGETQTSLNLSWSASTDDVGVAGYDVYLNGAKIGSTTATSYAVNSLACGTSYTLGVVAYDGAGNRSTQASVTSSTSPCSPSTSSCVGVTVDTATDIASVVSNSPGGTTFCISSGVHRVSVEVRIKPGDRLIGQSGAIVSGAKLLTAWVQSGSIWKISGQAQQSIGDGWCDPTHPLCNQGDSIFYDGKPLTPVGSTSALASGDFFFDYPNDTIYIADNPAGHTVEGAASPGFSGCGSPCGSTTLFDGGIYEKFAGIGIAISDGTVQNVEARWNHMDGIAVGHDGVIRNNYVHDNGLKGIGAYGPGPNGNMLIEGNELAHNSWWAGYDPGWESGGGKWLYNDNLTIKNNYSHDNHGPGFWLDTDNIHVLIDSNRIDNNWAQGVDYEGSCAGVISNNTIAGNGFGTGGGWMMGAGILDQSSPDLEVKNNTLSDNFDGIGAHQRGGGAVMSNCNQEIRNLYVHDNTVKTTGTDGMIEADGDEAVFTAALNNRWVHNSYTICKPDAFAWADHYISVPQWQAYGMDTTASFLTSSCW